MLFSLSICWFGPGVGSFEFYRCRGRSLLSLPASRDGKSVSGAPTSSASEAQRALSPASSGRTALDARFLEGLLEAAPAALAQVAALPLRRLYMASTSAAFMCPDVARAARRQSPVTLVSAFEAIIAMLAGLAATRIILLRAVPG